MIKAYLSSISKSRSLTAQIRNAELQILTRQQGVGIRADTLIKKIQQEMTAPSTLLLTVGIGFIIGEFTRQPSAGNHGAAGKQHSTGASPLRTALNLMTSVHTLYMAMPVAWKIRLFHQPGSQGRQASERQGQTVPMGSGTVSDSRKSKC